MTGINHNAVTGILHTYFEVLHTLRSFCAGMDLIIVQRIKCADIARRKIRHNNIRTRKYAFFSAFGVNSAERRC